MIFKLLIVGLFGAVYGDLFSLTSQPQSVYVEKGKSFTLNCAAANGVNTQYQWYMETSIPNKFMTEKYSGSGSTSSTLSVDQSTVKHGGFYQCKATSGGNVLYSNVAKVTVEYFEKGDATPKKSVISKTPETVRYALSCDVPASNPSPTVKWYKGNDEISDANLMIARSDQTIRVESLNDLSVEANSLVLFNMKASMAGTYMCKATVNGVVVSRMDTVAVHELTVQMEFLNVDYAALDISVTGASASSGDTVTVYCSTIGYLGGSVPTYTWYATNGAAVEMSDNLSDFNRSMVVSGVSVSHSYSCKACTGAGNCNSELVTVTVAQATPTIQFVTAPDSYILYQDSEDSGSLNVSCVTSLGEGNWMKDGVSVGGFPIQSPKASDSGYYQCYASTSDSWAMKSTQVVVTETIKFSFSVPAELDSSTPGVITCTVSSYPTPTVVLTKTDLNNKVSTVGSCGTGESTGCVRTNGNDYMITVDHTDYSSSGTYKCAVEQSYKLSDGKVRTFTNESSGTLAIVKDVDVTSLTGPTALTYGQSATFSCSLAGGREPHRVEIKYPSTVVDVFVWSSSGGTLNGQGSCTGDYEKTCVGIVPSVTYGMEGDLVCKAYNLALNSAEKTDSETLSTNVTRALTVELTGTLYPTSGANLQLTCSHYQKPFQFDTDSTVTWHFNYDGDSSSSFSIVNPDQQIRTVDSSKYEGAVVGTFNSVAHTNVGKYYCVSNGKSSNTVSVHVAGNSSGPTSPLLDFGTGEVNASMNVTCVSRGYPPPTLTWTIYPNKTVTNQTFVTEIYADLLGQFITTLVLQFTPTEEISGMMIKCSAAGNGESLWSEGKLVVVDPNVEAVVVLSSAPIVILTLVILAVICVVLGVVLVVCIMIREQSKREKYDSEGKIIANLAAGKKPKSNKYVEFDGQKKEQIPDGKYKKHRDSDPDIILNPTIIPVKRSSASGSLTSSTGSYTSSSSSGTGSLTSSDHV